MLLFGVNSNITLKLDQRIIREAKVLAARKGTSVSRLLAEQLEQLIRRDKAYDVATRRAIARLRRGHELQWTPPKSREDLHER